MRRNAVFQEGVRLHLIEGQLFGAYFSCVIILALMQFSILFFASLGPQAWMGPAYLFKFSAAVALILTVYFVLRVANQEMVPGRFVPLRRWLHQEGVKISEVALGQIALLCLQSFIFTLLSFPLLVWAGAIARATVESIFHTISLFFFYSLTYGVWGLVGVALWEHRVENRQVFVRCLFVCLVLLSALVYPPLNPVAFLLFDLGWRELGAPLVLWGYKWSASVVHFLFHSLLLALGLWTYRWALKREGYL
jgi:hypothetical protein